MSTAAYVTSTSFTIAGDWRTVLKPNQPIVLSQGVDGYAYDFIDSVSYGSGNTTINTINAVVTANLTDAKFIPSYSDVSDSAVAIHDHINKFGGGVIPAATISAAEIAFLQNFERPTVTDYNRMWRVDGSGEYADLFIRLNTAIQSSMAAGDILKSNGSEYNRLARGSAGQALVVNQAGNDLEWGDVQTIITGASSFSGNAYTVVYHTGTFTTVSWWDKADADYYGKTQCMGIVISPSSFPSSAYIEVQLMGLVTNTGWSWTPGEFLYLADSAGTLTQTRPEDYADERCLGIAISATEIFFLPVGSLLPMSTRDLVEVTAGENLNYSKLCYMDTGDSGDWKVATNDGTELEANVAAISHSYIANGYTRPIMLKGVLKNTSWTFTPGAKLYLGTNGDITETLPTDGYIREVGYAIDSDKIYFCPSPSAKNSNRILIGTAGESLTQFQAVYTDVTDSGEWKKALANGTKAQAEAWGMVVDPNNISNGLTGMICTFGFVTNTGWSWTPGKPLYIDTTAGNLTETEPGTVTQYKTRFATAISATEIFINPEPPVLIDPVVIRYPAQKNDRLVYTGNKWMPSSQTTTTT